MEFLALDASALALDVEEVVALVAGIAYFASCVVVQVLRGKRWGIVEEVVVEEPLDIAEVELVELRELLDCIVVVEQVTGFVKDEDSVVSIEFVVNFRTFLTALVDKLDSCSEGR